MDVVIDRQWLPDDGMLLVGASVQDGTVVVSLREQTTPPGGGGTPLHITVDVTLDGVRAAGALACPADQVAAMLRQRFRGNGRGAVRWALRLPGSVVQARTTRTGSADAQPSP